MNKLLESLQQWHQKISVGTSPIMDKIFLFSSPVYVIVIIVSYMAFVLYYGPRLMKNRKAFNLQYVIAIYNLIQVYYNFWILREVLKLPALLKLLGEFGCSQNLSQNELDLIKPEMFRGFWHYLNNKILDLLDTVFFVLSKKQSHVTFLHVQHHSIMIGLLWIIGKYFPGFEGTIVVLCNTIIHIIMYFYYFLTALGPRFRRYLWWKQYLTLLQILQFLIIIGYCAITIVYGENFNKYVLGFIAAEACLNLYLFTLFYIKSYKKQSAKPDKINDNTNDKKNQ